MLYKSNNRNVNIFIENKWINKYQISNKHKWTLKRDF